MILKNFNFNQPPRLVINGAEYIASNVINGIFHIYNKSQIILKDVWYKDERDRVSNSLKFPPFSLVEIYFGNDLVFFGIIKLQKGGTLNPFQRKDLNLTVIDFKEWLTNKPMDFPIYNKSPDWIVNKVISTLSEKRIIVGDLSFGKTDKVKAYSTKTKTAYDILRMVEKKTQSILQVVPNSAGELTINYYTKDSVKINKQGVELDLSDESKAHKFYEDYGITKFDWEENLGKFANKIRIESERALGETPISLSFNLNGGDDALNLLKPVGKIEKSNVKLYEADGTTLVRKLVVVTQDQADKGKLFDLAYSQNSNTITIGQRLIGKNQVVKLEYFPIVRVEYQMDNTKSQQDIASYSDSNGILFRTEKHNDETSPSDLIALGKGYLVKNSEPRVSLKVGSTKPIWDLGEHTKLTSYLEPFVNGDYVVYIIEMSQTLTKDGAILTFFTYHLMGSLDYDEELNKNDSQTYRDNPIYETADVVFGTRQDIQENVNIVVQNFSCEEKVVNAVNSYTGTFSDINQRINFIERNLIIGEDEFTNEFNLLTINMPTIEYIYENAFRSCTSLTSVIAPELKEIKLQAFAQCPITHLDVRKATTIGDNAFFGILNGFQTTEVWINHKFNTDAEKTRIFGSHNYKYIKFNWTNNDGTPYVPPTVIEVSQASENNDNIEFHVPQGTFASLAANKKYAFHFTGLIPYTGPHNAPLMLVEHLVGNKGLGIGYTDLNNSNPEIHNHKLQGYIVATWNGTAFTGATYERSV